MELLVDYIKLFNDNLLENLKVTWGKTRSKKRSSDWLDWCLFKL